MNPPSKTLLDLSTKLASAESDVLRLANLKKVTQSQATILRMLVAEANALAVKFEEEVKKGLNETN